MTTRFIFIVVVAVQDFTPELAEVIGRAMVWTLVTVRKQAEEHAAGPSQTAGRPTKLDGCLEFTGRRLEGFSQLFDFLVAVKAHDVDVDPFGDMFQSLAEPGTEFRGN